MSWAIPGAEAWAVWVLRGLLASGIIMLIAWAVIRWSRGRIQARTAHTIGLLALIPLALPQLPGWAWQLPLPTAFASIKSQATVDQSEGAPSHLPVDATMPTEAPSLTSPAQQQPKQPESVRQAKPAAVPAQASSSPAIAAHLDSPPEPIDLLSALLLVCLAGCALQTLRLISSWRRTQAAVVSSRPLPHALHARVLALVPELRKANIELRNAEGLGSPAAWGLKRKFILLPTGLVQDMDDAQLRWAVRHELAHHRRGDLLTLLGLQMLRALWWFHPLLPRWYRMLELNRECACDRQAVRRGDSPQSAARALVLAASHARPLPQARPRLHTQLQTDQDIMKTRITHLMKQPARSRLGSISPLLCTLLALGGFTLSQSEFVSPQVAVTTTVKAASPTPSVSADEQLNAQVDARRLGRAQNWLIEQQTLGGSWLPGTPRDDYVGEFSTTGVTALAMLALAQAGEGVDDIARQLSLDHARKFLLASLDDETGRFASKSNGRDLADHAMAIRALLAVGAHSKDPQAKELLRKAVRSLEEARNPYRGWRFTLTPIGDNDSFMTSLAMLALQEAQAAGFEVEAETFEAGRMYLDELRDVDSGRMSYQRERPLDPRLYEKGDDYPVKYTELCTAISTLALADAETELINRPDVLQGLVLVASRPPVWRMSNGSVDYYYWMFGAESMRLLGGRLQEQWHKKLRTALAEHQRSDGSWPAVDAWSSPGSEVHATACAAIAWQNAATAQAVSKQGVK